MILSSFIKYYHQYDYHQNDNQFSIQPLLIFVSERLFSIYVLPVLQAYFPAFGY